MHSRESKIETTSRHTTAGGAPIEGFGNNMSVDVTGTDEDSVKFIFMKIKEAELGADLGHVGERKESMKEKTRCDESAQTYDYVENGPGVMCVTRAVATGCFRAW